jgi:RES domain-containing protein
MGDAWVASRRSPVLRVPSVLVPAEHNYLINPDHSDFGKISMTLPQPFRFDRRLKSSK